MSEAFRGKSDACDGSDEQIGWKQERKPDLDSAEALFWELSGSSAQSINVTAAISRIAVSCPKQLQLVNHRLADIGIYIFFFSFFLDVGVEVARQNAEEGELCVAQILSVSSA